jgi:formylglycine-generating enzyme required for sulfatase activity
MSYAAKRLACVICFLTLALIIASPSARAAVVMQWTTVADPGNAPDTKIMKQDNSTGFGSVGYVYRISKCDVTNAQYVEFLNAKDPTGANMLGLYSSFMTSDANVAGINVNLAAAPGSRYAVIPGQANRPVTYVTWYSAIRFANWLNNGQGNADTESGAYALTGNSQTPTSVSTRNPGASIFLPSENEWYKAAYYKAGGANSGYWTYATRTDTAPTSAPPAADSADAANFIGPDGSYATTGGAYDSGANYLTDVGAYLNSPSAYGTFDQTGDIFNWNEASLGTGARGIRGGSWNLDAGALPSTNRDQLYQPQYANNFIGFRVAAAAPEPAGVAVWVLGGLAMLRRKRNGTKSAITPPPTMPSIA